MRIVCFHLNQIGDLAFSLPALKSIRDNFPEASITSVTRPGLRELVEGTGLVDAVLPRSGGLNLRKMRLARELASGRFDLAVVFSQSAECALLAYLAGAPRRVGFVDTSLGFLLTKRVPFTHPPSTVNNLNLVEACDCSVTCRDYSGLLRPTGAARERVAALLASNGVSHDDRIIAFSPGTSGRRRVKEWTDEGYVEVARHLVGKGLRVVVLGTVPAVEITQGCPSVIDLSGKTNLGEAAALLERCGALLAVDSGILHLAAAVGTHVVGLYGPSNPAITGPQGEGHVVLTSGVDCSPCDIGECRHDRRCMTQLRSDVVIEAMDRLLSQPGEKAGSAQS